MSERKVKAFDCVEMKRRLQEQIYEETKDLSPAEVLRYFEDRVRNSSLRGVREEARP
jgi:hypothetical protein